MVERGTGSNDLDGATRLDPLTTDDADGMLAVLGYERMYEFTGGTPPTLDELWARYRRLTVGRSSDGTELWFNWIVRLREDAEPIGVIQAIDAHIHPEHHASAGVAANAGLAPTQHTVDCERVWRRSANACQRRTGASLVTRDRAAASPTPPA